MKITLPCKVHSVEERFQTKYVRGVGASALFEQVSIGWFVILEDSHLAIRVGFDKPDLKRNDEIDLSITKVRP